VTIHRHANKTANFITSRLRIDGVRLNWPNVSDTLPWHYGRYEPVHSR